MADTRWTSCHLAVCETLARTSAFPRRRRRDRGPCAFGSHWATRPGSTNTGKAARLRFRSATFFRATTRNSGPEVRALEITSGPTFPRAAAFRALFVRGTFGFGQVERSWASSSLAMFLLAFGLTLYGLEFLALSADCWQTDKRFGERMFRSRFRKSRQINE